MRTKLLLGFFSTSALALAGCSGKDDSANDGMTVGSADDNNDDNGDDNDDDNGDDDTGSNDDNDDSADDNDDDGDSGGGSSGGADDTMGFIQPPDGGGINIECDVWAQDCAEGQKCMPWANDGGNAWNATKCSPVDPNPAQIGDPCTVEGSGVSGIDNCAISSMCWNVDPETNMGTCVAFCSGSEANPVCEDPATSCSILNEGTLILCLPTCDPLLQDCMEGEGCYVTNDTFSCVPDAGGEMGAFGEGCEFLNVCDPGLFCANPDGVPNCAGSIGCCSTFCDISDPNASAACPGAAGGQECTAWYEEGQAPPGLEDVGACVIPA
ncbi:MAG TPA: ribulose phosphate epimerase [Nannocystaceae bacterium]|nr:ribulose phosphate epimerase [Nannocystaceae bacterium]